MTEIEFCDKYCSLPLTEVQRHITILKIENGQFIGVAKACGSEKIYPAIIIGKDLNVIDEDGYFHLAPSSGRLEYQREQDK